jgi:hypothetical protein
MLFKEVIPVYSAVLLIVKADGTYSYHSALKG